MYNKVLLAFDDSRCAALALQEAAKLALAGAELEVLAVADISASPFIQDEDKAAAAAMEKCRVLLEQASQQLSAQGVTAELLLIDLTECANSSVAEVIVNEAADMGADAIVMGTHGRQGYRHFLLGSVAKSVSRKAACPVLLVRSGPEPAFAGLNPAEIYRQWPEDERLTPEA